MNSTTLSLLDGTCLTHIFLNAHQVPSESYFWLRHLDKEEMLALETEWQLLVAQTSEYVPHVQRTRDIDVPTWDATWTGTYGEWLATNADRYYEEIDVTKDDPQHPLLALQRELFLGKGAHDAMGTCLYGSRYFVENSLKGMMHPDGLMVLRLEGDELYAVPSRRRNLATFLARAEEAGENAFAATIAANIETVRDFSPRALLHDFVYDVRTSSAPLEEAVNLTYDEALRFSEGRRERLLDEIKERRLWETHRYVGLREGFEIHPLFDPAIAREDTYNVALCTAGVSSMSEDPLLDLIANAKETA